MDPQDFGFLDPDPQKYADPRIRIQGAKYQPKIATTKIYSQNLNLVVNLKRIERVKNERGRDRALLNTNPTK